MEPVKMKIDDCNILKKRSLLHLLDIQYQQETSVVDFYNEYRNVVMACLKKKGDVILWQDNTV
jgi:hypothetical protein